MVVEVRASDFEDAPGTLAVDVSTDGGRTWQQASAVSGTLYEYKWNAHRSDGSSYALIARATDRGANMTQSATVPVTAASATASAFSNTTR